MKQVVSNYSYSPATNVLTLSGVNIDQDQLLLVVAPGVGRTMYNFASGVTGVVSAGINTRVTLNASTASLTTTSPLVIYYDDQLTNNSVTISSLPAISGTVTANTRNYGSAGDNWISIPSLDLAHPDLGTISFAGNYRWNGVNYWGPSGVAPNNDFTYITWLSDGNDYFIFRLLYVSDALNQDVVLAECQAPTLEFPLGGWDAVYPATLVGGSFTFTFQSKDIQQVSINSSDTIVYISGAVTVSNSVTIGSCVTHGVNVANSVTVSALPVQLSTTTIGGTARLNVTLSSATTIGGTAPSYGNLYGGSDGTNLRAILVDSSGRTTVTGSVSILGTPSVTMGAISGTVTANVASTTVTISAQPSGALTTRFGSVTTANTSQITTAVTNTSRKYLLAQNISTGTVTIGIGFSPTTTQGIQLTAGAGLTFDSFVPTGAVYWLGATTGAAYTILEG